jgi:ribA/ribD-fused uncharacterized protein
MSQRIITRFAGSWAFLSNFYVCWFEWGGQSWPTAEHAYQASKAIHPEHRDAIRNARTPGEAKRFGRQIPLRAGWDQVKHDVMHEILRAKFSDPQLRLWLLATGDALLEEGNTWGDTYWGTVNGVGANHLGQLLMVVRTELEREARE